MKLKIVNIIYKFFISEPKKILGRWNIDYNSKKLNMKIDLSNEDHCGPCGQYVLSKRKDCENKIIDSKKNLPLKKN